MPLTILGLDAVAGNTTLAANAAAQGIVGSAVKWVVDALEVFFRFIVGPSTAREYVWDDPKFTVGIILWASVWWYWLSGEDPETGKAAQKEFHWTALMVLGLNLAALSMLQICGAAGFFGLVALSFANVRLTKKLFPDKKEMGESFEAGNIYEDLKCPLVQVGTIFLGQSILLVFLIYSVYHSYAKNQDSVTYTFWIAAYVSVQMSGFFKRGQDSQLGIPCDVEWWRALKETNRTSMFQCKDGEVFGKPPLEMRARAFMTFTVNTFYRDIIAFITPVLCMQSNDGVDFVQNCFALSYITTLDDVGEGKKFKIIRGNTVADRATEQFHDAPNPGSSLSPHPARGILEPLLQDGPNRGSSFSPSARGSGE